MHTRNYQAALRFLWISLRAMARGRLQLYQHTGSEGAWSVRQGRMEMEKLMLETLKEAQ